MGQAMQANDALTSLDLAGARRRQRRHVPLTIAHREVTSPGDRDVSGHGLALLAAVGRGAGWLCSPPWVAGPDGFARRLGSRGRMALLAALGRGAGGGRDWGTPGPAGAVTGARVGREGRRLGP